MHLSLPTTHLKLLAATAAVATLAFAGGVYWSHEAGTADAAEGPNQPATPHAWLGAALAPVTDRVAARLNIPKQDGLAVLNVAPDGPAAKAGLKQADVVKTMNGTAVNDLKAAHGVLTNVKPGDTVQLGVSRSGASQTIAVTAGEAPKHGPRGPHGPRGGAGFGMAPRIPELQGIPPAQMFDHMLGGSFKFKDKDNKDLTITVTPGKVTTASDTSVTITPNGGGGTVTFAINSDTKSPVKGSELKADTKVVVITKNGSNTAASIHPVGLRQPRRGGATQSFMPDRAGFGPGSWMGGGTAGFGAPPMFQMPPMDGAGRFEQRFERGARPGA